MRSIPAALTWEFLRRGRWLLANAFCGVLAFQLMLFGTLLRDGALDPDDPGLLLMQVLLTQIGLLGIGAGIMTAQGVPARIFTLPISTSGIAIGHLLPAAVVSAGLWAACVTVLNALLPLDWPILGPALFAAVGVPTVLAISWYTDKTIWMLFGLGGAAGALGLWFKSRFGPVFSPPDHVWRVVTPGEVLFLAVTAVGVYFIGVAGIARQRRHEPLPGLGIKEWLDRVFDRAPAENLPFKSAEQAQFWAEWRMKGLLLPGILLFLATGHLTVWFLFSREPRALREGVIGGGAMLPIMAGLIGLVIGNFGPTDANSAMGPFLGTRPLTSPALARLVLKVQWWSIVSATIIWQAAYLATSPFAAPGSQTEATTTAWLAIGMLILPWASASLGTLVSLTGRTGRIGIAFSIAMIAFLATTIGVRILAPPETARALWIALLVTLSVAAMLGTAWSFQVAWRRGTISAQTIRISFAALIAMLVFIAGHYFWNRSNSPLIYISAVGLAFWSIAPLAMAPLAVAWNRNR
jgi:hypothetical protein